MNETRAWIAFVVITLAFVVMALALGYGWGLAEGRAERQAIPLEVVIKTYNMKAEPQFQPFLPKATEKK